MPVATRVSSRSPASQPRSVGLLGLPLFGTALALELEHPHRIDYYWLILPGLIASATGTGVFLAATDHAFFGSFDLGPVAFHWWYVVAAVPLGVLGAGLAVVCALMFAVIRRITTPLAGHTLILPVVGGGDGTRGGRVPTHLVLR